MDHQHIHRRKLFSLVAGAVIVAPTLCAAEEEDITPAEDLMREHGVLKRVLLIYDEVRDRIARKTPFPPKPYGARRPSSTPSSSSITRSWRRITSLHNKLVDLVNTRASCGAYMRGVRLLRLIPETLFRRGVASLIIILGVYMLAQPA